jgi:hypothetical protein
MNKIPTSRQETSVESRDRLEAEGKAGQYRKLVHDYVLSKGAQGCTTDEIEVALKIKQATASCFVRFLTIDDLLYDSDDRRPTRTGRNAIVWKARTSPRNFTLEKVCCSKCSGKGFIIEKEYFEVRTRGELF